MAVPEDKRVYNFSDGTLIQKTDTLIINIQRDAADFATRGTTAATVSALQDMRDDFDNYPTDPELQGREVDATLKKVSAQRDLTLQIKVVRDIAYDQYKGKGLYSCFGFKNMDNATDASLHRLAKRTVRVGTTLLPDLTDNGLTPDVLKTVAELDKTFDAALDAQEAAIETRDIATQARVRKGNDLYREFSRLCAIGKSLYASTDEAKYNDYVILDPAPGTPTTSL